MKKVWLVGAAAVFASLGVTAAAQDATPGPDIHFKGPHGQIERGVRCATRGLSAEQRKQVDRAIQAAKEDGTIEAGAAPRGGVSIPVVFTVIHDGVEGDIPASWITDQMTVLNNAYSGKGFSFTLQATNRVLDKRAFTGCYSNQNFKKTYGVDVPNTLNFYSCKPRGNILGYSYLPSSLPEDDYRHGVVVLYSTLPGGNAVPYHLGDTGTHEVGHYLGLDHTFANGCNAPGDAVADTPYEASAAYGCPTGRDSCTSTGLDPITNFMDYTDDPCMNTFSSGQASRMTEQTTLYKPSLVN